jgi:hypothetical protein
LLAMHYAWQNCVLEISPKWEKLNWDRYKADIRALEVQLSELSHTQKNIFSVVITAYWISSGILHW